jgi:hypothetical protein
MESIYSGVNSLEQNVRSGISTGIADAARGVATGSQWVTSQAQEYAGPSVANPAS